jgi:hypothetical protein
MLDPLGVERRRHLLDGGFTVLLLTLAIAFGYGLLAPSGLRATPVARTPVHPVFSAVPTLPTEPASPDASASPAYSTIEVPRHDAPVPRFTPPDAPKGSAPELAPASPPPTVTPTVPSTPTTPRTPWVTPVNGRVLDERREPVRGAAVVVNGTETFTDAEGVFSITGAAEGPLLVKLPGYEKVTIEPTTGPLEVVLKQQPIKAAYLTYFGVSDKGIRNRVLDLVARTELNAVVIDVKGDRGWIPYRTEVPLALAAGAQGPVMLDIESMLSDFRRRGIYTIARIVTFKDNVLGNHRPDWAITDTRTGKPWIDRENLVWMDPFREEVWAYNIAIAKEAVAKGFDEVQFDYVRFPTDGRLAAAKYSRPVNKETRLPTIAGFLARARREIGPTGAFVAADLFGYTAFNENDTDIGQRIEELAPHLDYICPMVYPSGYHVGIPGYRNPVQHPYEVVYESVRLIRKRSSTSVVRVRPWLQDFRDYAFDRRIFGVTEVRAQIKGGEDAGAMGFMLWNPRNDYTGAALRTKGSLAAQ